MALVRNLIRKLDIRLAKGLFWKIRLVEQLAVYADSTVFADVDIICRPCDITLDEQLVAVIKGDDIAGEKDLLFTLTRICPFWSAGDIELPYTRSTGIQSVAANTASAAATIKIATVLRSVLL